MSTIDHSEVGQETFGREACKDQVRAEHRRHLRSLALAMRFHLDGLLAVELDTNDDYKQHLPDHYPIEADYQRLAWCLLDDALFGRHSMELASEHVLAGSQIPDDVVSEAVSEMIRGGFGKWRESDVVSESEIVTR